MCVTCGCGDDGGVRVEGESAHVHPDVPRDTETLLLEERVLAHNDHLASHVRARLTARRITAVNLMSSPGAGKTSLLERTVVEHRARGGRDICVIEGDQETSVDADRIRAAGARAVQVNTGTACHLDAAMVRRALDRLDPASGALVFVENVGNLVCPALFDIGEHARVVVISTTEGDDKPLKYPHMFRAADVVVVNKTDLTPYLDFDLDRLVAHTRRLNPQARVLPVSVRTGENLETWHTWLAGLGAGDLAHTTKGAGHGAVVRS